MEVGGALPPPLPLELEAFHCLVASYGKRKGGPSWRFVKKVDIPSIELPTDHTYKSALKLVEHGMIKEFSSLWYSPQVING